MRLAMACAGRGYGRIRRWAANGEGGEATADSHAMGHPAAIRCHRPSSAIIVRTWTRATRNASSDALLHKELQEPLHRRLALLLRSVPLRGEGQAGLDG